MNEQQNWRKKFQEFNCRADKAREDGYVVMCGKVYEAESVNDPNAFPRVVCDVMDYQGDL